MRDYVLSYYLSVHHIIYVYCQICNFNVILYFHYGLFIFCTFPYLLFFFFFDRIFWNVRRWLVSEGKILLLSNLWTFFICKIVYSLSKIYFVGTLLCMLKIVKICHIAALVKMILNCNCVHPLLYFFVLAVTWFTSAICFSVFRKTPYRLVKFSCHFSKRADTSKVWAAVARTILYLLI